MARPWQLASILPDTHDGQYRHRRFGLSTDSEARVRSRRPCGTAGVADRGRPLPLHPVLSPLRRSPSDSATAATVSVAAVVTRRWPRAWAAGAAGQGWLEPKYRISSRTDHRSRQEKTNRLDGRHPLALPSPVLPSTRHGVVDPAAAGRPGSAETLLRRKHEERVGREGRVSDSGARGGGAAARPAPCAAAACRSEAAAARRRTECARWAPFPRSGTPSWCQRCWPHALESRKVDAQSSSSASPCALRRRGVALVC